MQIRPLPNEPRRFQMFIGGRFTSGISGQYITRLSPGHGVPVAEWPSGVAADAEAGIAAARQAFDKGPWPRMSAGERAAVLFRIADLIEQNASKPASR